MLLFYRFLSRQSALTFRELLPLEIDLSEVLRYHIFERRVLHVVLDLVGVSEGVIDGRHRSFSPLWWRGLLELIKILQSIHKFLKII